MRPLTEYAACMKDVLTFPKIRTKKLYSVRQVSMWTFVMDARVFGKIEKCLIFASVNGFILFYLWRVSDGVFFFRERMWVEWICLSLENLRFDILSKWKFHIRIDTKRIN